MAKRIRIVIAVVVLGSIAFWWTRRNGTRETDGLFASGTVDQASPVVGLRLSKVRPSDASVHTPPISIRKFCSSPIS